MAQRTDGEWLIVELGDGQVAGLPDEADVAEFYRRLKERLERKEAPSQSWRVERHIDGR